MYAGPLKCSQSSKLGMLQVTLTSVILSTSKPSNNQKPKPSMQAGFQQSNTAVNYLTVSAQVPPHLLSSCSYWHSLRTTEQYRRHVLTCR
jgi:hypothetical protein